MPTVAIGGINVQNVQRVLFQSQAENKQLDGVAVVSAIMSADSAKSAAQMLRHLIAEPPTFISRTLGGARSVDDLTRRTNEVVSELRSKKPLCHNMTNLVVQNFAANVALAV